MYFQHTPDIRADFPELVAGCIHFEGIREDVDVAARIEPFHARARARLAGATEGEFPEIQAWRRAFSKMGLKPTQYRCASEALLRRFRKEDSLPAIHPLIDLCNAISLAWAVPIAAYDLANVDGFLEVRYAAGNERYLTFAGEIETPVAGEVIFADVLGQAHARRWTNRQSGLSAIRPETSSVLIVAEAMHEHAATDVPELIDALANEVRTIWSIESVSVLLSMEQPRFDLPGRHSVTLASR